MLYCGPLSNLMHSLTFLILSERIAFRITKKTELGEMIKDNISILRRNPILVSSFISFEELKLKFSPQSHNNYKVEFIQFEFACENVIIATTKKHSFVKTL